MSPILETLTPRESGITAFGQNLGASSLLLNSEIPASPSHLLLLKSAEQESTLRNDEVYIISVRYPRLRPHSPIIEGDGLSWNRTTVVQLKLPILPQTNKPYNFYLSLSFYIYYIKFFIKNQQIFFNPHGTAPNGCPMTAFKKGKNNRP